MKKVKNILLLLTAIFTLGCSQTIVFEDVQTPTPTPTPKPEPEPEPDDKQLTSAPYAVGDYYYDGTKEGVVFDVWDNGNSGKIVSMTQSGVLRWSSDETEQKRLIGADSETDGAANMAVVKAISGWETKYPAFKWCADLGDGWYLPAKEELLTIYNNKDKLNTNLTDKLSSYYWSSTESDYQGSNGSFYAWYVFMSSGYTTYNTKFTDRYVRAVATFGNVPKPEPEPEITSAPYAVGDYYNDGTKEGVVFEVSADGTSGKIVSMTESTTVLQWSSDETEQKRLIGADSETDGAANMAVVKAISGWETKYPAFKWCADLGDGWYLPAKEELLTIYNNKDKLNTNLTDKLSSYYWSSTESDYQGSNGSFYAWYVFMSSGYTTYNTKFTDRYVRAVATFGNVPKPEPEPEITSAPYAVGDYYNDGTKEGVVFEVSADGTSGKIVSMTESTTVLQWSSDETEQKRLIGADSETDGAANMAVVKAISGWETKYPAFKWCADLGDDWYLPAKEELLTIYNNKDKLNTNLTNKLSSGYYWSSTEYDYQYSTGEFCAWGVNMGGGYTLGSTKDNDGSVRAVSAF